MPSLGARFPRYDEAEAAVPAWIATPVEGRTIHRFFDTSPFSPSGRFLAVTRLPAEDRLPRPGEAAEVVVVDLETAESVTVAETRGWDTQVGAHVQWGADDSQLFFNDLDVETWRPFGVRLDPATGARTALDGTVYSVAPDGRSVASPSLLRIGATQPGYGVVLPRGHAPASPEDDGVFVTDTATGASRLLVSVAEIVAAVGLPADEWAGGDFFAFHVRWSPSGERLQLVLRWLPRDRGTGARMRAQLVTMRADGSELHVAVPAEVWALGGHHPSWCPDGEHVLMNLRLGGGDDDLRFAVARFDGTGLRPLSTRLVGSGHPTLHPDGRHLLTDAYPNEPVAFDDGTVPIRFVDLVEGSERILLRVPCVPSFSGPRRELRVDPHPAWDRGYRRIAFNAWLDGTRQVCVADLDEVL